MLNQEVRLQPNRRFKGPRLLRNQYKTPYDFAFDGTAGIFVLRDPKSPDHYEFRPEQGIYFRKGPEFQGPSINAKIPKDYYFDEEKFTWMPIPSIRPQKTPAPTTPAPTTRTSTNPTPAPTNPAPTTRTSTDPTPAPTTRTSTDPTPAPTTRTSTDPTPAPTTRTSTDPTPTTPAPTITTPTPTITTPTPVEKPTETIVEVIEDYPNSKIKLKRGVRGLSGNIPDDFFFTRGSYELKDPTKPDKYKFDQQSGVWRLADSGQVKLKGEKVPTDYFFSHEDGKFYLKKDLKYSVFVYDPNTLSFIQQYRAPVDYYWNGEEYILKPPRFEGDDDPDDKNKKKRGGRGSKDFQNGSGELDYERLW
jgi:hypothetical protein